MPIVPNLPISKDIHSHHEISETDGLEPKNSGSEHESITKEKGETFVFTENERPSDELLSKNVFADPEVCAHYVAIYEKCNYEGRHAFDPTLTWTSSEEKILIRKIDWNACLWAVGKNQMTLWNHTEHAEI